MQDGARQWHPSQIWRRQAVGCGIRDKSKPGPAAAAAASYRHTSRPAHQLSHRGRGVLGILLGRKVAQARRGGGDPRHGDEQKEGYAPHFWLHASCSDLLRLLQVCGRPAGGRVGGSALV